MPQFTLKFKLLVASLLLFGSIATLFYNQITLNSKLDRIEGFSNTAYVNSNRAFNLVSKIATPSPTFAPVVKPASKSAIKR